MSLITIIGILVVCFVFFIFVKRLGVTFPVLEFLLLIAGLQWVVAPSIEFLESGNHFKYYMYTDELTYMSIIVPCYIVFVSITLFNLKVYQIDIEAITAWCKKNERVGKLIIALSIVAELSAKALPGGLSFVFFLINIAQVTGVLILVLSDVKRNWIWISVAILFNLYNAIINGMFHRLLLDFSFLFIGLLLKFKFNKIVVIGSLILSSFLLVTLQKIKEDYRSQTWGGAFTESKVELFMDLFLDELNKEESDSKSQDQDKTVVLSRLNQGWIISKIINNFEEKDFLNGKTIMLSLEAVFVPRFLNQNKTVFKSKPIFEELTGLSLGDSTAMGPSLIGEFYGNFGYWGCMLSLAIWGFVLRKVYLFMIKKSELYPALILWIPFIFYQVVKAETMFLKVSNHLFKAGVVLILIHFIWKKTFYKIKNAEQ